MNKFARTQLHFNSKINIMSSASKHSNKKNISEDDNEDKENKIKS